MPPSPDAFRDRLAGLDPEAFAAFVAALYEARGRETERVGDDVLVSDGRSDRRLAVRHDGDLSAVGEATDAVVVPTLGASHDADRAVVDAADLRQMALYAVDGADRARLFRRFFGVAPDEMEGVADDPDATGSDDATVDPSESTATTSSRAATGSPTAAPDPVGDRDSTTGVDDGDDPDAGSSRLGSRRLLVIGVAILLVTGGVALAVGPTLLPVVDGGNAETSDSDGASTASGATATPATDPAGLSNRDPPLSAPDAEGPFPPGVDADGIENASAMADAHEAALSERSYRLSVVSREFVGGRPTGVARERTVVEGPTRYRSTVTVVGTFRQEPGAVGRATTYADGTERFVRLTAETDADGTIRFTDRGSTASAAGGDGWRSVAVDSDTDPFANRTAAYLRDALDVENSTMVGSFEQNGTRYFWIELQRRPPTGADAIGSVLVDEHGVVHELRHEYAYVPIESSSVRTVVVVRTTPGNVTVTPPPWL